MSPEQIKSARDVDARSDLWAAGVMFYEMLTGRSAFPAPTEYARLTAVLTSDPEPIERVDPALAPLAAFVGRALKKDRAERFSSALEMARALAATVPHAPAPADAGALRPAEMPHAALSQLPPVPSAFAPYGGGVPTTSPMRAFAPARGRVSREAVRCRRHARERRPRPGGRGSGARRSSSRRRRGAPAERFLRTACRSSAGPARGASPRGSSFCWCWRRSRPGSRWAGPSRGCTVQYRLEFGAPRHERRRHRPPLPRDVPPVATEPGRRRRAGG